MYISKETHYKISMIVRLLGNGEVTIADFTENVISGFSIPTVMNLTVC